MNVRARFWLTVLDAVIFCGGFGGRAYMWAVRRATDATDEARS